LFYVFFTFYGTTHKELQSKIIGNLKTSEDDSLLLNLLRAQDKNNNVKDIKAKPSVGSPFIKKPDNPHAIMFKQILDDNIALRAEPA
ncbi:MAG: hypothetical protein R8L53_10430, partial [Mariprofundales bacterium]